MATKARFLPESSDAERSSRGLSLPRPGHHASSTMELLDKLVSQLGISEEQARGGTGLLLKFAKEKLGGEEFSKLSSAIPDADSLIGSAPDSESGGGILGKVGAAMGGSAGGLASLAGGFSKLGLDPSKTQKFVSIVTDYLRQRSPEAASALTKASKDEGAEAEQPTPSM